MLLWHGSGWPLGCPRCGKGLPQRSKQEFSSQNARPAPGIPLRPTCLPAESSEGSSSEEEEPPQRPQAAAAPRRKKGEEEPDPEQMRKVGGTSGLI